MKTISTYNLLNLDILRYLRVSEKIKTLLTGFCNAGKFLVTFKRVLLCPSNGINKKRLVLAQQMGGQSNFLDSIKTLLKH